MNSPIYDDPVVAEVHAIRAALLDDCGGDLAEYRRRTREHQSQSDRHVVTVPLKEPTQQCRETG